MKGAADKFVKSQTCERNTYTRTHYAEAGGSQCALIIVGIRTGGLRGAQLTGNAGTWLDSRGFRPVVRVRAIMFI